MTTHRVRIWTIMSLTGGITLACGLNPIADLPGKDKTPPSIPGDDSSSANDDGPKGTGGALIPWRPGSGGAKAGAGGYPNSGAGGGSFPGAGGTAGAAGGTGVGGGGETPVAGGASAAGGQPASGGWTGDLGGAAGAIGQDDGEGGSWFFP